MAAALGVKPQSFDNRYRPLIPEKFVVKEGRRVWFTAGVVSAILEAELRGKDLDEDGLFASNNSSSPSLERGRDIKAKLLELEFKERLGVLIEVDKAERLLDIAASRIRSAGDKLARKFGDDARQLLVDALEDAEQEVEQTFGCTQPASSD